MKIVMKWPFRAYETAVCLTMGSPLVWALYVAMR